MLFQSSWWVGKLFSRREKENTSKCSLCLFGQMCMEARGERMKVNTVKRELWSAYICENRCCAIRVVAELAFAHSCGNYLGNIPCKTITAECWMHSEENIWKYYTVDVLPSDGWAGKGSHLASTLGVHLLVGLDQGLTVLSKNKLLSLVTRPRSPDHMPCFVRLLSSHLPKLTKGVKCTTVPFETD